MGICGSVPLTDEEAKNQAVVQKIFDIWGGAMFAQDPAKLDALAAYGSSTMKFENTLQQVEATKEIFTVPEGTEGWVNWMKDIFMTKKMEPQLSTILPSGSFMQGLNAFGNTVTFKNVLKGYKVNSTNRVYMTDKPFIESHKLTFTADNKIEKWEMIVDKDLAEKMGPVLWADAPATAA